MTLTTRLLTCAAITICLTSTARAETLLVTNFDASGEGSLQAALDMAAASVDPTIILLTQSDGLLETPTGLIYTSPSPLRIFGNGLTVTSAQNVTLFSAIGTSDLSLSDMTFSGPGGWNIEDRGDIDGPAGKGIFLDVADDATGTVSLRLHNIYVEGVAGHGIHVSDCTLADECGRGGGGAGDGSAASINVEFSMLTLDLVGQGSFDADGLRVDERGEGDITLLGTHLYAFAVGADGVELDEGQDGNVHVDVMHGYFTDNGAYCDPVLLATFMPDTTVGEFDEGTMATNAIPGPITGSPDDRCFERELSLYDDGSVEDYEFAIDVDDGFDVDEAGPGSIFATFSAATMLNSLDEGFDFDEEDAGDIDVVFTGINAAGNMGDAIKLSEAGTGNVFMTATAMVITGNGGVGIVAEEEDAGNLMMILVGTATSGNNGGDLGVEAVQEGSGIGEVFVIDTEIADGIETDGAVLDAD